MNDEAVENYIEELVSEVEEEAKPAKKVEPVAAEERKKVVLVDDVTFFLMTAKTKLDKFYEMYLAKSAEILFELLENVIPDLILLDINMPEVNGFKILETLKEQSRTANIPVIILSGSNDRKNMLEAMKYNANDFLGKPVSDKDLLDAIDRQLYPERFTSDKPIVLAIDDSPTLLHEINHALNDIYSVYTLPVPDQLENILSMVVPDLFILDYNMPRITGFELFPLIRKHPEHSDTPILFLTTEGTPDHVYAAIMLGASAFMVKPLNDVLLREKVGSHLKHYQIWRRIRNLDKVRRSGR